MWRFINTDGGESACYTANTMITLLLGSDSLAKKQHIDSQAKQLASEVEVYNDAGSLDFNRLFEPQLFGPSKLVVLDHCWKQLDIENLLEQVGSNTADQLYLLEDSLDKRLNVNKQFLKDPRVTVIEKNAPSGLGESVVWIRNFAKENNINIDATVATNLANAILPDQEATLSVLRTQNELQKLKSYANGEPVTTVMIEDLVESASSMDVFALTNAIAAKNKKLALQLLDEYFRTEVGDEKANAIKVTALLSEQFRSLLIALDSQSRRLPEDDVLAMTGWKSGRLFIMNKTARNFTVPQVKMSLAKLENLDRELKTGSMPPHVVLDLIIADI